MKILVIPCAKPIRDDLKERFGDIPATFIPISGIPLLECVLKNFKDFYDEIRLVINPRHMNSLELHRNLIEPYLATEKLKLYTSDGGRDISSTILAVNLCYNPPNHVERLDILFGDTLFDKPFEDPDTVSFSTVRDTERWTCFKREEGRITEYDDKLIMDGIQHNIFTGFFSFSDVPLICRLMLHNTFYTAVETYSRTHPLDFVEPGNWVDVGHLDKYLEHQAVITPRYFNSIKIDSKKGILTKSSEDSVKLMAELHWYENLPKDLRYLTPQIYDSPDSSTIKMQYYPYTTVHELILSARLTARTMDTLLYHLDQMQSSVVPVSPEDVLKARRQIYLDKTISRLTEYEYVPSVKVNGISYVDSDSLLKGLPALIENSGIINETPFTVMHGDYCGSNILVDTDSQQIKLIDPRGSFGGDYSVSGDPLYDTAKLFHSIEGLYDFIITDQFSIDETEEGEITFNINITDEQRSCLRRVKDILEAKYSGVLYKVKLIEALLFLSMIPLHKDKPLRQKAMYFTGIELLNQLRE